MRIFKSLLLAGCGLALWVGVASGSEEQSGATSETAVPVIVESVAGVTTYSDGAKVLSIASFSECPDGWVCLWEHANYEGRMLQFQDRGYWQDLTVYSFNDKASSWRNRINQDARLAEHTGGGGQLVCLQPNSSSSSMGGFNDQASSIRLFKTSDVC